MDTLGFILTVVVHKASIQDRAGAKYVFKSALTWLKKLNWFEQMYAEKLIGWVQEECRWKLEIMKRTDKEFKVLPKRWIVERTASLF